MAPFIATFVSPVLRVQMTQKGKGGNFNSTQTQISTQKGLDAKRELFEEYFIKKNKGLRKFRCIFLNQLLILYLQINYQYRQPIRRGDTDWAKGDETTRGNTRA